jgi:hypothetical protein
VQDSLSSENKRQKFEVTRPRWIDQRIPRTLFRRGSTTGEVRAEVALEVSVLGGGQVGKAGATTSL